MTDSEEYILVNKLCDEIDNHNIANIKKIIKNNKYHLYDKLVLHMAVKKNNAKCIALLIVHMNADIDIEDENGCTALHIAADLNQYDCLKILLKYNPDKEKKGKYNMTPLMYATSKGHIQCMKLLLDAGVDRNPVDNDGWTPLMYTVSSSGSIDSLRLLLDYEVDTYKINNDGNTAFCIANIKIGEDQDEYVELLFNYIYNNKCSNKYEKLRFAIKNNKLKLAQSLIDEGVDINDINNKCILHSAVNTLMDDDVINNSDECIKLLLNYGADVNKTDHDGWTPLMIAAMRWATSFQKLLLDAGAEVNMVNPDGDTALMIAMDCHVEELELLIDATYNDIVYKVLIAVSKHDIIFDTAFIIFKKIVKKTFPNEFGNEDFDRYNKKIQLYKLFQEKFSKFNNKTP